ncbi:MAG: ParA family partition ATPase [Pseudomonadota bacterium]
MAGRIITIAQQKGGAGKTTLSAHLAVAWSKRRNTSVAILDTDPQGSLGQWFEARETALGDEKTGLVFKTASGWGARREARYLARDFDVVVVDTPPKADTDAKPAIEAADHIVVAIQPSPIDLWATKSTLELADGEKTPVTIVLNRVPPRAALTAEMISAMTEYGKRIAKTQVGNRVAFAATMRHGLTVLEVGRANKAADEIAALAKELWKVPKS